MLGSGFPRRYGRSLGAPDTCPELRSDHNPAPPARPAAPPMAPASTSRRVGPVDLGGNRFPLQIAGRTYPSGYHRGGGEGITLFSPPPIDPPSASELVSEPLGTVGRIGDEPHGELAHDGKELGLDAGVHPTAPIELACDKPVQAFDSSVQPVDGRVVVDPVPGKRSIWRPGPPPLPGRQVNDRTHG